MKKSELKKMISEMLSESLADGNKFTYDEIKDILHIVNEEY